MHRCDVIKLLAPGLRVCFLVPAIMRNTPSKVYMVSIAIFEKLVDGAVDMKEHLLKHCVLVMAAIDCTCLATGPGPFAILLEQWHAAAATILLRQHHAQLLAPQGAIAQVGHLPGFQRFSLVTIRMHYCQWHAVDVFVLKHQPVIRQKIEA